MPIEDIFDLVESGRTGDALASAQEQARANPSDAALRTLLFELYCVAGLWDRALSHASLATTLDARADSLSRFAPAMIGVERARAEVWKGAAPPRVLGPASAWSSLYVEALKAQHGDDAPLATSLRVEARRQAPPVRGFVDGVPASSIADADERLGPLLEVFVAGAYAWLPFSLISSIIVQAPRRIIDRVWINAETTLHDGRSIGVAIPVRYPNSERPPLGLQAIAASTTWVDDAAGGQTPIGQRLISLGPGMSELPILSVRRLDIEAAPLTSGSRADPAEPAP